jgi:hypothetical protein
MAHVRQSEPDYGVGCQATVQVFLLRWEADGEQLNFRAGLSSVDTLSHLSIETYQSTRVVNIANSSITRTSGKEMTKWFQSFDAFRDPNRVE